MAVDEPTAHGRLIVEGPDMAPPTSPTLGSAPAKPGHSSEW